MSLFIIWMERISKNLVFFAFPFFFFWQMKKPCSKYTMKRKLNSISVCARGIRKRNRQHAPFLDFSWLHLQYYCSLSLFATCRLYDLSSSHLHVYLLWTYPQMPLLEKQWLLAGERSKKPGSYFQSDWVQIMGAELIYKQTKLTPRVSLWLFLITGFNLLISAIIYCICLKIAAFYIGLHKAIWNAANLWTVVKYEMIHFLPIVAGL